MGGTGLKKHFKRSPSRNDEHQDPDRDEMKKSGNGKKIGQLLLESGLVNGVQLDEALEKQKKDGGKICSHLIRLGFLKADSLLEFLRQQFGVAAVNVSKYHLPEEVISTLPPDVAHRWRVLPVNITGGSLTLAMEDPRNEEAITVVEKITSMKVEPLICPQSVMEESLRAYYPAGAAAFQRREWGEVLVLDEKSDPRAVYDSKRSPVDLAPPEWLKRIIFMAVKKRAREIHIEPREEDVLVRYRSNRRMVNGEKIDYATGMAIIRFLGSTGHKDKDAAPAGLREGWMKIRIRNRDLKLFHSTFPVIYGDRVVMKLIDEEHMISSLADQGLNNLEGEKIVAALERKNGIYLVSSPLALQRDRMLYHLIEMIKNDGLNIITIEKHLQFPLPGVNQTLFSKEPGFTQTDVLTGALTQGPDIIGVTELCGYEILEQALAAASQCLVLGALPMAGTYAVIKWLQKSGYASMALAHTLVGILSVRVVPGLCPDCRRPMKERPEFIEGTRDRKAEELEFYESAGCDSCQGTGVKGWRGIFESLIPDEEIRDRIAAAVPARIIYEEAQRMGMQTLMEDGILKASRGEVDIRDVLRVAPQGTEEAF